MAQLPIAKDQKDCGSEDAGRDAAAHVGNGFGPDGHGLIAALEGEEVLLLVGKGALNVELEILPQLIHLVDQGQIFHEIGDGAVLLQTGGPLRLLLHVQTPTAFFQHILKSLDPRTGRCAILFPHGILFRNEESEMRKNLVDTDMVECVIGIGKNLFYNSPMEACIVICRANKPANRRGKVLFINAKHEVTRKNAQSYLEQDHIDKIANTYFDFAEIDGFSAVADLKTIKANNSKLSIALYVRNSDSTSEIPDFDSALETWLSNSSSLHKELNELDKLREGRNQ